MQALAVPEDGEVVAAQAVGAGLDDGHRRGGGDGGVDGIAATLQHAQAGLRRQRLRGGDHIARKQRAAHAG
jgi:hypothetical protein